MYNALHIVKRLTVNVLIVVVMAVAVVLPASQAVAPKTAEAGSIVYDPTNWVQNNITAISSMSLAQKELIWDGIFHAIAKVFLRAMVTSIVNWINSGFQGSPAFLTDLDGFLRNVADQAIGEFIYNDPALNFLCSPFQLDVKIALAVQYNETRAGNYQPQCTLSQITDNVEGFLAGDFSQGGWGSMIELVSTPTNNPMGAHLDATAEAYVRIIDNQGQEITTLGFGDGFFSMEICDVAELESGSRPNCIIGTPGSVIANSINKALGAGQDELIAADEVNEIFNALFAQLAQRAISGVFGLLGLGGNTAYADSSYGFGNDATFLEAIQELENEGIDTNSVGDILPMRQALDRELANQALQQEIITRVNSAQSAYDSAADDLADQGCTLGFPFPASLSSARSAATIALSTSESTEATLVDLINRFDASTNINDQIAILDEYEALEDSGVLRTATQNLQTQLFIEEDLTPEIEQLEADIADAEAACG